MKLVSLSLLTFATTSSLALATAPAPQYQLPKGLETLAGQCLTKDRDGKSLAELEYGSVVFSAREILTLGTPCALITQPPLVSEGAAPAPKPQVLFGDTSLTQYIVSGVAEIKLVYRLSSFQAFEGALHGTFNRTVASAEDAQIPAADIVSKNPDGSGVVVKRQYREVYVVATFSDATNTIGGPSRVVQRLIFELDSHGQPVVGTNDRLGAIVDPQELAAAIGGNADDYASGIYFNQESALTLRNCLLLGDSDSAKKPRKLAWRSRRAIPKPRSTVTAGAGRRKKDGGSAPRARVPTSSPSSRSRSGSARTRSRRTIRSLGRVRASISTARSASSRRATSASRNSIARPLKPT